MKEYNISLSQFADFATKNSLTKYNSANSIYNQIISDFDVKKDYWLKLKNRIKKVLRTSGLASGLDGLEDEVPKEKKDNYLMMINSLKKFWGKKKFERIDLKSKNWKKGHIRISVSPQLCYSYRDKIHVIYLYLHVKDKDKLDKPKADLILQVMHDALNLEKEVSIELLDVARNKLFIYKDKNREKLSIILAAEARELGDLLDEISEI